MHRERWMPSLRWIVKRGERVIRTPLCVGGGRVIVEPQTGTRAESRL